jgi:hypothetical protein
LIKVVDLLKLDSIKRLSAIETPPTPAAQPSVAAPNENVIGTRSRSSAPTINIEGNHEDNQEPSFPWKTDFVPRRACLLPPTMIDIVVDIPTGPKKPFVALRASANSLAFGADDKDDSSTSSDQSTNLSAHELTVYHK